jgi:hypothetical protein
LLVSIDHADGNAVTVHLQALPVALAAKARDMSEDLLREFALITADVVDQQTPAKEHEVPLRLMDLVVTLTQELHEAVDAAARRFEDALAGGASAVDLDFEWPADIGPTTRAIADTWDEADAYCWSSDRLMTLATPVDCAAYRRWFFAQVLDQLDGRHPIPWPESSAARGL